jgi:two-component sensor histidine kinase
MRAQSADQVSAKGAAGAWLYVDEISHRTMNDYAFMLATVERASRAVRDPIAVTALADVSARLAAGAGAYRVLGPPRDDDARRLDEDLEQLCAALSVSGLDVRNIGLTLCCEPVTLSARRCWIACLIVSELVSNALKHAFCDRGSGEIAIDVRAMAEQLRIVVSDNGCGAKVVTPGRGMGIVNALADELDGALLRRQTPSGSTIVLICPLQQEAGFSVDGGEPTPTSNGSRERQGPQR